MEVAALSTDLAMERLPLSRLKGRLRISPESTREADCTGLISSSSEEFVSRQSHREA